MFWVDTRKMLIVLAAFFLLNAQGEEAEEHFRRYPSTADKLTPKFRNVVEEFLSHESAE